MITLLTGGSACGKSYYAEASAVSAAKRLKVPLYYVATMLPYGEEGEKRIRRHREQRKSKGFLRFQKFFSLRRSKRGRMQGDFTSC